jgi:hypothetical protein
VVIRTFTDPKTNIVICVGEIKLAKDLTPEDFKTFFNSWENCILSINPLLIYAAKCDEVE